MSALSELHSTDEEILNKYLNSISLETEALNHILNMEGDMIESIINMLEKDKDFDINSLIAANQSVESIIDNVFNMEIILTSHLREIFSQKPQK